VTHTARVGSGARGAAVTVLAPDLIFHQGRVESGLALAVRDGRIERIASAASLVEAGHTLERLPGRLLLPGFVNAHSHAFQRVIRGRTQWRPARGQADFWSWREAMYGAALGLAAAEIQAVARFCFLEMLLAGYTTVGEFHYLHRDEHGQRYADPLELSRRVIAAAEEVGIRIAHLHVCYARGGVDRELLPEQRRFATPDLDEYLRDVDALIAAYRSSPGVTIGVAPHSVRAVPPDWLRPLHDAASSWGVAFHMHAAEQPAEVEAARAAWGRRPVELLADLGVLQGGTCLVHATHLTDEEVRFVAEAGVVVCACPTTERDLGDGFLRGQELLAHGGTVAVGSDSQTIIDPLEEIRLIEYHERLRRLQRVVLGGNETADTVEPAPTLLRIASAGGAAALKLHAGELQAGMHADLVGIDLEHPSLAGWTEAALPALLALSAPSAVVADVWVGGHRRVTAGRHPLLAEAALGFSEVARRTPLLSALTGIPPRRQ
jgi:formimidoylglutamate deiminase